MNPLKFARYVVVSIKANARKLLHLSLEGKILFVLVVAYIVIMSFFSITRMYALKASAWDLGNYNQAMYTFTFEGKLFYLTSELQNNPSGSLFGIHFSPILFLQVPFYLTYPHPETLLVIQATTLALGAIPTYLISRYYFARRRWHLLMSLAYLLNPLILGINVFDYHPEIFIPTFYLFIVYFYLKGNWKGTWLFSILLMSTIEFAPTLTFLFGAYFLVKDVLYPTYFRKTQPLDKSKAVQLVALAIVSVVWLLAALRIITFFSPNIPLIQGKTEYWPLLGASNLLQVPIRAVTSPLNAFNALAFNASEKAAFLLTSAISWLFLPLLSVEFWVLSSSWLFPALLSNSNVFYTVGVHYPSFFAGQLTYSGILMVKRFIGRFRFRFSWKIVLVFIFAGTILSNPFASLMVATNQWAGYGLQDLSGKPEAVQNLLSVLPPAAVLAGQNIFPLVSSKLSAYTIPWQINYYNDTLFFDYVYEKIAKVDYILINADRWLPLTDVILSKTTDFGVVGFQDNVLLLKRGYNSSLLVYSPLEMSFDYISPNLNLASHKIGDVTIFHGTKIPDSSSSAGVVLIRTSDFQKGDFCYLRAKIAVPGEYKVTFRLKPATDYLGKIMEINFNVFPDTVIDLVNGNSVTGQYQTFVHYTYGVPPEYEIAPKEPLPENVTVYAQMLKGGEYTPISRAFIANVPGNYEFMVVVTQDITISLDRIDLELIKPYPFWNTPVQPDVQYIEYGNPNSWPALPLW